jgi:Zn-dependent protease
MMDGARRRPPPGDAGEERMQRMHDPTPPWDPSAVMEVEAATVEDARHGAVWRWRGRLRTAPRHALATAQAALARHGMTALLRTAPGGRAILLAAPTPPLPRRARRLAALLALLTVLSVGGSGWLLYRRWDAALIHAAAILAILGVHEAGHLWAARRSGIDLGGPYAIPFPLPPFGTLGAVCTLRTLPRDRAALLRMAAAGPLAGAALALPLLIIGLRLSAVLPCPTDQEIIQEGTGLIYAALKVGLFGRMLPSDGMDVMLHPLAFAAWLGLLLTALNLLPIAHLDGRHLATALLGERGSVVVATIGSGALLAGGVLIWPGWAVWGVIGAVVRMPVLPADALTPPPRRLALLAALTLLLGAALLPPLPLVVRIPVC